jgi:hypothetical protein
MKFGAHRPAPREMGMNPANQETLEQRVIRAAEAALQHHKYVSPIDVFTGMGILLDTRVEAWREGRIDCLEQIIQSNLKKISASMAEFRRWAEDKGLQPRETAYLGRTRQGTRDLRFSVSGDPAIEKAYRTHYVSPELSDSKLQKLQERLEKPPQPVVFQILRESECSECGTELGKNAFLLMEAGQPLCLPCAQLADLEYLPAGDTALTRRATKYSGKTAVVVRFTRTRGRYERQGVLVEKNALEKAERECVEDADHRAAARVRGAEIRREEDRELVARMTERLSVLFPNCPPAEARRIAEHTAARSSGRVGRTEAGRDLEEGALTAAVTAAIRHTHTDYDALLASGMERSGARDAVADRVRSILATWRGPAD